MTAIVDIGKDRGPNEVAFSPTVTLGSFASGNQSRSPVFRQLDRIEDAPELLLIGDRIHFRRGAERIAHANLVNAFCQASHRPVHYIALHRSDLAANAWAKRCEVFKRYARNERMGIVACW